MNRILMLAQEILDLLAKSESTSEEKESALKAALLGLSVSKDAVEDILVYVNRREKERAEAEK